MGEAELLSPEIMTQILTKAWNNSYYLHGKNQISPKKLRRIISYTLVPKLGITRVSKDEQNKIIKQLKQLEKIQYIAPQHIVLLPLADFDESKIINAKRYIFQS